MTAAEPLIERETILGRIASWPSEDVFLLVGAPGTGKSQIARQAARIFDAGYAHWCDAQDDATLSPSRFVSGLALALANHYPAYAAALVKHVRPDIIINATVEVHTLKDGARAEAVVIESMQITDMPARAAFDRLIRVPMENIMQPGERFLVVVDAIDESLDFHPTGHLVDLLTHARSCPGLRFLLTSRSGDLRVEDRLGQGSLDLDRHDDDDLLEYAKLRLSQFREPDKSLLAERLAASGNFLYIHHVLNDLNRLSKRADISALALPASLTEVYREFLKRTIVPDRRGRDWVSVYRPVLSTVAVGRGRNGIPVSLIAAATGFPVSATMDALLVCGQFIRLSGDQPGNMQARIYHRSFQDFLLNDETFTVYPVEGHAAVARALDADNWRRWSAQQKAYGLAYLPMHLNEGGSEATLIALARDQGFLAAQRAARPNEPNIDVTTMRLAIQAAYPGADSVVIADLLLALAARSPGLKASTPLQTLKLHGLTAALAASAEQDADLHAADELLLSMALIESQQEDDARHVAYDLLTRAPHELPSGVAASAAVALARICQLEPVLGLGLARRLLGTWGRQNLVRHLLDLKHYNTAVRITNTLPDWDIRYKMYLGIAEHMLDYGESDRALALFDSIGESVDPDNDPPPDQTLWWAFREVVWAVGLSLAMKGDGQRGQAVLNRRFSLEPKKPARVSELHAAAGYAAHNAGDTKAASRAFSRAETLASRYADSPDEGSHRKAVAWTYIGRIYLWCGLAQKARKAARVAMGYLPRLDVMQDLPFYDGPVHDDPFHGACIQGTYRNLAILSARAGEISTAITLATDLAQYGSRDAVDAFAVISMTSSASAKDREQSRQRSVALVERLAHPLRASTLAHLTWGMPEADRKAFSLNPQTNDLCRVLDAALHPVPQASQRPERATANAGPARVTEITELAATIDTLSYEELRALPDEPEPSGYSAFDSIQVAERVHARARSWARAGYHSEAMRQFDLALRWEAAAHRGWEAFQAIAGVPKTTEYFAREEDDVAAIRVLRLCSLASLAAMADDREGISIFLERAQATACDVRFEQTRSVCATRVAATAARYGMLDYLASALRAITIRRQELFSEIWISYCAGHSGQENAELPAEVWPLLTGLSGSPEDAVIACEGLAKIFPAHSATISDLIRSRA